MLSEALENTVEIVKKQIQVLDEAHTKMVACAELFTAFIFSSDFFKKYDKYHTLLSDFANSLIPVTPYLPSEALPSSAVFQQKPVDKTENFLDKVKFFNSTVGIVVMGIINAVMLYVAFQGFIPWVVPVVFAGFFFCMVFGIPERLGDLFKKPLDEDKHSLNETPTEWIAKDIQIINNKYDTVRVFILSQTVEESQLPAFYKSIPKMFWNREQQEIELFPTECLNVVGKIMVFCNNAYYIRKGELMAHLPGGRPVNLPQSSSQVGA